MADTPVRISVKLAQHVGTMRPINGLNDGPLVAGGLIDLSAMQKAIAPNAIRLHDCHWPNPDVVDFHAVFPNPDADPARSESYDFRLTDEYIAAVRATGAAIIYRLGQSIEHTTTRRFVHPPKDPDKWAQVAIGIIRHYNEGWANGYRYGIKYWEIWNEPDVRPQMWSGSDADYFRLYEVAAKAIHARFPDVKVGGPAASYPGGEGSEARPSPFAAAFLEYCRSHKLPLDFFSWHCYTNDSKVPPALAQGVRRILDNYGFRKTESHLNEWNYLPDNDWSVMSNRTGAPEARRRFYQRMSGAEGAAFVASVLIGFQDAPVDVCCFYQGGAGAFGLTDEFGVPEKTYYAQLAFRELLRTPARSQVTVAAPGAVAACAGIAADGRSVTVLIAKAAGNSSAYEVQLSGIPWSGPTRCDVRLLDGAHDLASVSSGDRLGQDGLLAVPWAGPCVVTISLRPEGVPEPSQSR